MGLAAGLFNAGFPLYDRWYYARKPAKKGQHEPPLLQFIVGVFVYR